MNTQLIIIIVLFIGAAAYLIRRTYKSIHSKDCAGGCNCNPAIKEKTPKSNINN
jgi:attachment p12 family protein